MAEPIYGQLDQFLNAAERDEAWARQIATTLEQRGQVAEEQAMRAAYLDLLEITPGERVLDVGCGSGVVLRDLARRVAPAGKAIGVDPNRGLLTIARELATTEGLDDLIELHEGDARALPFGDGEFDAVAAVTTLFHVPGGERVIPEMVRVVRPGGRVGIFDRDNDARLVNHPDHALTRRILAANADHAAADSWIARRSPRLVRAAGLVDVQAKAFTAVSLDPDGFAAAALRRAPEIAAQAGAITEEERDRWLATLEAEAADGGFLVGNTYLLVWGTKPPIGK